ncbi:MAG: hypothetical protein R3Y05_01210 [bacterium]
MKSIKIIASVRDTNGNFKSLMMIDGVYTVGYNSYNLDKGVRLKSIKKLKEICDILNDNN